MSKLKCDFTDFNSKKTKISSLIELYNALYASIIASSLGSASFWMSDSQKIFFNKIMERQVELKKLSENLDDINNFLNEVITTYENIEGKYS